MYELVEAGESSCEVPCLPLQLYAHYCCSSQRQQLELRTSQQLDQARQNAACARREAAVRMAIQCYQAQLRRQQAAAVCCWCQAICRHHKVPHQQLGALGSVAAGRRRAACGGLRGLNCCGTARGTLRQMGF